MSSFFPQLKFDIATGSIDGGDLVLRRLSDMPGYFADQNAVKAALTEEDPVLYSVSSVTLAKGDGQLHFGLGTIFPGRIGEEYFMTKGHLHTRRIAAELYIGLSGTGFMLLEHESRGDCELIPLSEDTLVYVPGETAHRTINTGAEPLVYLGVYPADAGHDYAFIKERNFSKVVVDRGGRPAILDRQGFMHAMRGTQSLEKGETYE